MSSHRLTWLLAILLSSTAPASAQEPSKGSSRWGPDDEKGAINLITPSKVLESVKLIQKGVVYPLGRAYEEGMPLASGRHFTLLIPQAAPPAGKNRIVGHEEFVATHLGQVGTALDGLGHVGIGDVFYNGFHRKEFVTPKGLTHLGIENVGVFLTRGVLLDIASLKRKSRLEKGYEITEQDLKEALKQQQLNIRPGDVVLIHTGWGSLWLADNELFSGGEPGLGMGAAQFLVQRQVVLVGSDNWGIDVVPQSDPELIHPVHQLFLTQNGIYLLENLDTGVLAREKVHEFAFFFAPLRIKGATGSPGNPVAIR